MNSSRVWFVGAVCLLLAGWGATGRAQSTTNNQSGRIIIYPEPTDSLEQLKKQGITKVEDYGSYWLVRTTDSQLKSLKRTMGNRLREADSLNRIELSESSFDITQGQPAVPANLQESADARTLLRIVQFKGPIVPAWIDQLHSNKNVRIINYIPNNAYLVSLPAGAESSLQSLTLSNGPVQWIGTFHPAHKLAKGLLSTPGVVGVRIAVLDDSDTAGVLQELGHFALVRGEYHRVGSSQWNVTMQVAARDLPAIAQIPSVLWVQPNLPIVARDELQGLVLSGDLSPSVGDSYTNFLFGVVGFLQDTAYYPVLDICDTGVDDDSPYCAPAINDFDLWHPDFALFPTFSVDPSDACCYGDRKIYEVAGANSDTTGPLGHGTAVASIAIGADGWTNEIVNCFSPQSTITTNMTISNVCIISGYSFLPCVGPNQEPCCLTVTGCPTFVCFIQTNLVVSNGVCKIVTNPPLAPFFVQRRDDQGFQMGLGISPYGTFGVSSMTDAQTDPEGEMASAYISLARISNNSWNEALSIGNETGAGNDGAYDALSQSYDQLTRDVLTTGITNTQGQLPRLQEMLFVFSAGNDNGQDPINGGYGDVLITPPATAKNVITVGSTDLRYGNVLTLSSKSSFGPTRDGRIKPDVVAPGGGVDAAISQAVAPHQSCAVDCGGFDPSLVACGDPPEFPPSTNSIIEELYATYPGIQTEANGVTSFAAPAVSGGAQLLYSYFITPAGMGPNMLAAHQPEPVLPPSPAMMKAYIMNSARYLPIVSPFTGAKDKLPSIGQGMGMIDLGRMFDGLPRIIRDESTARAIDLPLYSTNTVVQQTYFTASGQYYELSGTVVDPSQEFRVTLAWTDAPGTPGNGPQLVNNLDLQVTVNGQTYYGNDFDTQYSTPSVVAKFDALNNVESVVLPPGASGPWSIIVRATNIAGQGVPNTRTSLNQDFALVVYNADPFSVSDLPPAGVSTNNTCQTAAPITTFPFTWTNTLSTNNYVEVNPSPTASRGGIQEFFKLSLPSPGTEFDVNTFGSSFDTVLSVWRGGCGSLVEVTSNNDASNTLQSAVSFTADGFEDYYIIAEPHNHALSNSLSGTLVLNATASSSQVVIAPDPVLFPDQITGTTGSVHTVTVQNGLTIPLQVQSVTVTGANASAFVVLSESCSGSQLAPTNGTCVISVVFAPSSAGSNQTADLVIVDSATGSPQIVPLLGNGLPPAPLAVITPTDLVFSNQSIGSPSAPQTITVQNNGSAPLVLSNTTILGTGAGDFKIASSTCGNASSVSPGGSCSLSVVFQPTTNGDRFASISFTNNAGTSPQSVNLIGLGCAAITVSPATLPAIATVASYTTNFTASGGAQPYTFTLSGGSLPTGLTLSQGGILTGTPTALGDFTFSVTATDANGCLSPAAFYTVTVGCGTLTVLPATLPGVLQGTNYSVALSVPNGVAPFTFRVTSGSLPAGINLVSGTLTGTPTIAGADIFNITATDSNGCTGVQSYTIVVAPAIPVIQLSPVSLTFMDQQLGTTSAVQRVVVSNLGTAALIINSLAFVGGNTGDFVLVGSTCLGTPIAPGSNCTIGVESAPQSGSGLLSTTLLILDNVGNGTNTVAIQSSGVAPVATLSVSNVVFNPQVADTVSPPQTVYLSNTGNSPLTISSIVLSGVNPGDFIESNFCGVLQPSQFCRINIQFAPTAVLPRSAVLLINSDATNGQQQVQLSGTGVTPQPILTLSPSSLNFGIVTNTLEPVSQTLVIGNNGTFPLFITNVTLIGSSDFSITADPCLSNTLLSSATCNLQVTYNPSTSGVQTATLQIGTVPTGLTNVTVTGGLAFVGTTTNCPGVIITVTPAQLGPYVAGATVNQQLTASGGTGPYTFSTTGNLPLGLALSSSGSLTGSVSQVGSYVFTVQATDHLGCTSSPGTYTVQVQCPTMTLSPQILPGGIIGQPYLQSAITLNGAPPTTVNNYLLTEGAFPPGLAFDAAGGIAGTPTQLGIFTFTIRVINATGCFAEQVYTINIGCVGLTMSPATLSAYATIGTLYSQQFSVSNAPGPFGFTQTDGSLPNGLQLTSSGVVTGIVAGTSSTFTLTATNNNGCSVSQTYTLIVALSQVLVFTPPSLSPLAVGAPVAQQFTVSGGTGPITYSVVGGALPAGLTLSSSGDLTGTVTNSGTSTFTVLAKDATGAVGAQQYSVSSQCPALPPATPLVLTLGAPASVPLGSNSALTVSGSLPPGLTLTNGVISGTPTNNGTFIYTITASGPETCSSAVTYTTQVACAGITITPGVLRNGTVGALYSSALTAVGGAAPYTFTVAVGSLPSGLNLSPNGLIAGTPLSAVATGLTFQVQAVDAAGCQAMHTYSMVIGGSTGTVQTVQQIVVTNTAGIVTLKVSGNGALSVNQAGDGSIAEVAVVNSDASTALAITVKKAPGSDGQVNIGAITVDGDLHTLSGKSVNIVSPVGVAIGGAAGSITLNSLQNSQLSVGGLIKSAIIKSFVDSQLLAPQVGKISLGTATPQPVGKRFGVQATVSIGSVTVKSPAFKWNKSGPADQSNGDFHVTLNQGLAAAE